MKRDTLNTKDMFYYYISILYITKQGMTAWCNPMVCMHSFCLVLTHKNARMQECSLKIHESNIETIFLFCILAFLNFFIF